MPEKAPNRFSSSAPAAEASGKVRPAAAGEFMSCAPACWSVARCICVRRGLHSRGGALERLAAPRGPCPNQARQAFLCRVSPRRGGPGINSPRRPGEEVDAAQAFALARAHVVPRGLPGEAMPFAFRQHQSGVSLSEAATPKFQSLVRSCATNAGKGATSVAFGADVCGVHARP